MPALLTSLLGLAMLLVPEGAWLGVYLAADREEAAVTEVVPDSPAQKAGLKAGDVILAVGDTKTPTRSKLIATIGAADPGDRVALKIKRGTKSTVVVVKLGKRPSEIAVAESARPAPARRGGRPARAEAESAPSIAKPIDPAKVAKLRPGKPRKVAKARAEKPVKAANVAPNDGVFLGVSVVEDGQQLIIERVIDGSPAQKAGLEKGERIANIGRRRMRSLADLDAAIAGMKVGSPVRMTLMLGDERRNKILVPGRRSGGKFMVAKPAPRVAKAMQRPAQSKKVKAVETRKADARKVQVSRRTATAKAKQAKAKAKAKQAKAKKAQAGKQRRAVATQAAPKKDELSHELEAMRKELKELRKELEDLRKQLRRRR
ncbi:MAG: PDZ domain-containing protein [bacterium]|nr:PDZ domain-containing protein [bacterium]